jgi:hypothetical protein
MECSCCKAATAEGKKKKYEKYEIEDAARTLIRAEEIKSNKELSKLVSAELDKQEKAIRQAKGKK